MFATNTDQFGQSRSPLDVFLVDDEEETSKVVVSDKVESSDGKPGATPEKKEVVENNDPPEQNPPQDPPESDPDPEEDDPEDDRASFIDESIIEEAGMAGVLDVLTTIDPEFVAPSEEASVDEILMGFDEKRKESLKKDPEFINQVRQELMDEMGLNEESVVAVTNRKKGVNHKKYNEYQIMERYADLDFDTDQEITNLFAAYYSTKGVAKEEAERLIGLDMQGPEKEALVSERKQFLKNHAFSKIKELEDEADQKSKIITTRIKEQREFVQNALSTGVIGGKKRSIEEIELFKKMVAPGTTEVELPTGEKVKMSRLQAYNYNKEHNVEQNFGNFFDEIISIGSGIKEVKDAAKAKSTQRGTFMQGVNKHLKNKKIDTPVRKIAEEGGSSKQRNEKSAIDVFNDD